MRVLFTEWTILVCQALGSRYLNLERIKSFFSVLTRSDNSVTRKSAILPEVAVRNDVARRKLMPPGNLVVELEGENWAERDDVEVVRICYCRQ